MGVGGGEQREAAGEAKTEDADGAAVVGVGHPLGGLPDGGDGVAADVVVLHVRQLGGEYAEAAGGHGGGEGDEARLVHAEVVDAVENDERGSVGMTDRGIEASTDGAGGERESEVAGGDGLGDQAAEERGDGLVGDEIEDGYRLQMGVEEGQGDQGEKEQDA
jgi:hypothetical protein